MSADRPSEQSPATPQAQVIEKALGTVYARNGKTKGTMIEALAQDLANRWDTLVERGKRRDGDGLQHEVMLVIWNWYAGGGTAAIAAERVVAAVAGPPQATTAERPYVLHLFSRGLLSKWGFNDGDMPDSVWDRLDEEAVPGRSFEGVDWHAVLRLLVRRHLLPVLDQSVEVFDIDTLHNPIRASTVNGVEVDHYADYPDDFLTPEAVEVTWEQIIAADRDVCAAARAGQEADQ